MPEGNELNDHDCLIALTAAASVLARVLETQEELMSVEKCRAYGNNLAEVVRRVGYAPLRNPRINAPP